MIIYSVQKSTNTVPIHPGYIITATVHDRNPGPILIWCYDHGGTCDHIDFTPDTKIFMIGDLELDFYDDETFIMFKLAWGG